MFRDAEELEHLTCVNALWDGVVQTLRKRGIRHVIYITATGTPAQGSVLMTTCPGLYTQASPDTDPFLSHCCNSYDITRTGPEFLPDHDYLPDAAKAFIKTARAEGFLTGFGIPTRLRGADRYGGFNLGTTLDRETFLEQMWLQAEQFRLFCLLIHRRLEELAGTQTDHAPALIAPEMPASLDALSPREAEVIYMLARGLSRKEAARVCGISLNTVSEYAKTAYRKLGIHNRAEAARLVFGQANPD
ncbi:LuxR C-terminal-related transcriptional regulator [Tateyamaria sp. ANG-S1]|uniref:helix-turn-helix transcriptional regulator n=1 Tax=Tateyamaria sp. ANG-S1 TaxID=1577905 RepID=UPI000689BC41|nr:LuxR C-terminal-related transcriptional regulator [Tateyamaria sp. ANG-S1]